MRMKKGITLIEALVVIVVLGILASIVIPRVGKSGLYDKQLVYTTARQIGADMRLARRFAIAKGVNHRVEFFNVGASKKYRIQKKNNGGWDLVGEEKEIPGGITVTGDEEVEFESNGSADGEHNFSYARGGYSYSINVKQATGRVKITEE